MRLSVRALTKSFGATKALSSVAMEAKAGEVHAVLGENGAGKSTLMSVLAGLVAPDGGEIVIDGVPYHPRRPSEARRAGVALVSQELALCPHMTVAENVTLGAEPTRHGWLDRARIERDVTAVLAEVAAGRISPSKQVSELSLADQQLVEIAKALVARHTSAAGAASCKILIFDEPTSSLGKEDTARLFSLVRKLRNEGVTILYISHFLEEVMTIADRYTVLRDGKTVGSGVIAETTTKELVTLLAGRELEQVFHKEPRVPGEVVLDLQRISADPKPTNVTLTLRRGEVVGIAGLIGAGRTELFRAIFGLETIKNGTVTVKGWSGTASPKQRLEQGLGLLSEDRQGEGLATSLSIADNVVLSHMAGLGPFAKANAFLDGFLGLVSPAKAVLAADEIVRRLSIKCSDSQQRVSSLSGGNQQKVALARLLHHDVDVWLLDEPTRGIDVGSKAQIYALIDELARSGKAVLMISSYLPELLGVCDRIAVMCRGHLGESRAASDWTEHSLLEAALGAAPLDESHGTALS